MTTEVALPDGIERTKVGKRHDWRVPDFGADIEAFTGTEVIDQLRKFFDALEAESEKRKDDPVAMAHALARMDALLADVRYVRDSVKDHAAQALLDSKIRRLTVEGTVSCEAAWTSATRTWDHPKMMKRAIEEAAGTQLINPETGEAFSSENLAAALLEYGKPSWLLGKLKEQGIDPNDYSEQSQDEDGKATRKPSVRINDNLIRRSK